MKSSLRAILPAMRFFASIIQNSVVDKSWRQHNRIGGDIGTIRFTLVDGRYVSQALNATQVMEAQNIVSIRLEAMSLSPEIPPDKNLQPKATRRVRTQ